MYFLKTTGLTAEVGHARDHMLGAANLAHDGLHSGNDPVCNPEQEPV